MLSDESDPVSEDETYGNKDLTFYNFAKTDRRRCKVIITEWVQKFKKTKGRDPQEADTMAIGKELEDYNTADQKYLKLKLKLMEANNLSFAPEDF